MYCSVSAFGRQREMARIKGSCVNDGLPSLLEQRDGSRQEAVLCVCSHPSIPNQNGTNGNLSGHCRLRSGERDLDLKARCLIKRSVLMRPGVCNQGGTAGNGRRRIKPLRPE